VRLLLMTTTNTVVFDDASLVAALDAHPQIEVRLFN
jgi:hypothetical protein